MRTAASAVAFLLFVQAVSWGAELEAPQWTDKVESKVRLPSGLTASYSYHFGRNSIIASRIAGDRLVALTTSGCLLRFDLRTLALKRERFGTPHAVCLGSGLGGEVLVGLADGIICRVGPETLELTRVGKLPGYPMWVGAYARAKDGVPAYVGVVGKTGYVSRHGGETFTVHDLAERKAYKVPALLSAFLLDSRKRLWLGLDAGEWGGWCGYLDFASGGLKCLKEYCGGVYGFVELQNGRIWAYGGTSHMGHDRCFIARVDRGNFKVLFDQRDWPRKERKDPPERPLYPITHVLRDKEPDRLLVFSYGEIFRVDAGLKKWEFVHDLKPRYRPGRPDAVGCYPAVSAAHVLGQNELLCATIRDGYVGLTEANEARYTMPNQFEAHLIYDIVPTVEGSIFLELGSFEQPWQLVDRNWRRFPVLPPGLAHMHGRIHECRVLAEKGGVPLTLTDLRRGPYVVMQWPRGEPQVIAQGGGELSLSYSFNTPDGELWIAWYGELKRLVEGRWKVVGVEPGTGLDPRVVDEAGPPWIVLDGSNGRLLELSYGRNVENPTLVEIALPETKVHDALDWSPGVVLLATDLGLRVLELATGVLAPASVAAPEGKVELLCRDGVGRIWMAGDGLWMLERNGRTLHDFDALPVIGSGEIRALAADPKREHGVVVSLGRRGVAFIRARGRASPDQ